MQKKIIALAIAAAFAAPVAMAETANVVIYGVASVSADSVYGASATGAAEQRDRISSNNSYIGFKGSEDLGDGVSAVWQYETQIAFDRQDINNTGATASTGGQSKRNTFAGLSSKSLGTLTFGVQDTPLKTSTAPVAQFVNTLADPRAVFTLASVRAENSALYVSPNMGGFVASALYSSMNEAGNGNVDNPSLYSVSGSYTDGPIYAVLAYEKNTSYAGANVETNTKTSRAGFGYTFGDAKVGLAYEKNNNDSAGLDTVDANAWYLSGAYKMGSNTLKASYTKRSDNSANAIDNDGATQTSIGVDHAMSKRTTIYALYTTTRNDTNGTYSVAGGSSGIAQVPSATGDNASGVSLGMVHSF